MCASGVGGSQFRLYHRHPSPTFSFSPKKSFQILAERRGTRHELTPFNLHFPIWRRGRDSVTSIFLLKNLATPPRYRRTCGFRIPSSRYKKYPKAGHLYIGCGGGGIRTREALADLVVFKTTALDHYATPPESQSTLNLLYFNRVFL